MNTQGTTCYRQDPDAEKKLVGFINELCIIFIKFLFEHLVCAVGFDIGKALIDACSSEVKDIKPLTLDHTSDWTGIGCKRHAVKKQR